MTTSGGGEILELVLAWFVTNALTWAVVILDERKLLDEPKLERAWPPVSRDAAIVAFGILAVPVHFVRTRGHLRSARGVLGFGLGLAYGFIAVVLILFASSLLLTGLAWALDLPDP